MPCPAPAPGRGALPVRSTAQTAEPLRHRRAETSQRGAQLGSGRSGPRPHAPRSRPAVRDRAPPHPLPAPTCAGRRGPRCSPRGGGTEGRRAAGPQGRRGGGGRATEGGQRRAEAARGALVHATGGAAQAAAPCPPRGGAFTGGGGGASGTYQLRRAGERRAGPPHVPRRARGEDRRWGLPDTAPRLSVPRAGLRGAGPRRGGRRVPPPRGREVGSPGGGVAAGPAVTAAAPRDVPVRV